MQSNKIIEIVRTSGIEIKTIIDQITRVTNVEVRNFDEYGDTLLFGRGKARWNSIDYYDPEIGKQLALGRALQKYGRKLANLAEKQSCSPGEYKARQKRERIVQEFGEVFYRQFSRPHPKTIKYDPETFDVDGAPFPNASQQPKTAQGGQEIDKRVSVPTRNLKEVIDENKAKLLGAIEKEESKKGIDK